MGQPAVVANDRIIKRAEVQQTILRISGAIQVLEELLAPTEEGGEAESVAVPESAAELVDA